MKINTTTDDINMREVTSPSQYTTAAGVIFLGCFVESRLALFDADGDRFLHGEHSDATAFPGTVPVHMKARADAAAERLPKSGGVWEFKSDDVTRIRAREARGVMT